MDYGKTGAARRSNNAPRHAEHNAKGSRKNPYDKAEDKTALLQRMKAAAASKKQD